ncbi:MAG TPA: Rap1a/Tai family immunity protein [Ferrovibrio sp.]|jgi:hypothetical protein|uniref:Rap1a/Tai family immunity protein n=1 Tax=Ferrovibrio sp. TaxID=1917215 RepID=UPI002B4B922F|nr:Rap1a/Tai family immunity protein [Ferrovibrio sp.]HLT76675.1 Rap1a/Tai family immunity protein [Ferrovibrio sp.]
MRWFAALALALFATSAAAQTPGQYDAQLPAANVPPPPFLTRDMTALCEAADSSPEQIACLRYLQGAVAMYELTVAEGTELTWFCAPREAPGSLLRQQFLNWAADNPDQADTDAIQAVRAALSDAFPCQE